MRRVLIFAVIIGWVFPVFGERLPPLVVAVDSSRSLKPSDIADVHSALIAGLEEVVPKMPIGLVTFDDSARWLVEPTTERIRTLQALKDVEPAGTTTVLNDALFLAAQRMEQGGVILVISDGRDENSAVTVEDVESLCARHKVRLLTVGVGRNIDDKALRRMALLTRGSYLGGSIENLSTGLSSAFEVALESLEMPPEPTVVHQAQPPVLPAEDALDEEIEEDPRKGVLNWGSILVLAAAGLALLIGAVVVWLFLSRSKADRCSVCGAELPDDGGDCLECQIDAIRRTAEDSEVAEKDEVTRVPDLGDGAMAFETRAGNIEQTVALGEIAVLTVHEEKREPREYTLPRDRIFAVGRAQKSNTLQVRDQTVSAQHFKVVYKESRFYVVDLWTTNGTSVNNECVRVHALSPGDVIRAGLTEFIFSTRGQVEENPEAKTAPPSMKNDSAR